MKSVSRLQQWENRAEWPLAAIAVIFLAAYSVQVLAQPRGHVSRLLDMLMYALYAAFAVDYVARLALAERRLPWFFRHLLDLAIIALPFLRPLRLLRLVVLVGVLQKAFGDALRGRVVVFTASTAVLLVYASSLDLDRAARRAGRHVPAGRDGCAHRGTTLTARPADRHGRRAVDYPDRYEHTAAGWPVAVRATRNLQPGFSFRDARANGMNGVERSPLDFRAAETRRNQ